MRAHLRSRIPAGVDSADPLAWVARTALDVADMALELRGREPWQGLEDVSRLRDLLYTARALKMEIAMTMIDEFDLVRERDAARRARRRAR
ncbi:hypothetical protein [Amycolatopsis sp. NPDC004378]